MGELINLNYVDIVIVVLILLSGLIGVFRGLIRELISLASWIIAVILAITFGEMLGTWIFMGDKVEVVWLPRVVGTILIFVVVLVLGALIQRWVGKGVELVGFQALDRSLGLLFGLVRGALVVISIGIIFKLNALDSSPWNNSFVLPLLMQFERFVLDIFQYFFAEIPEIPEIPSIPTLPSN